MLLYLISIKLLWLSCTHWACAISWLKMLPPTTFFLSFHTWLDFIYPSSLTLDVISPRKFPMNSKRGLSTPRLSSNSTLGSLLTQCLPESVCYLLTCLSLQNILRFLKAGTISFSWCSSIASISPWHIVWPQQMSVKWTPKQLKTEESTMSKRICCVSIYHTPSNIN